MGLGSNTGPVTLEWFNKKKKAIELYRGEGFSVTFPFRDCKSRDKESCASLTIQKLIAMKNQAQEIFFMKDIWYCSKLDSFLFIETEEVSSGGPLLLDNTIQCFNLDFPGFSFLPDFKPGNKALLYNKKLLELLKLVHVKFK